MCFSWYCQKIYYLPEMKICWYHICTIWYIWGFHWFSRHDLSSAIGFYDDSLADIFEIHALKKKKNYGLWLSEQTHWYTAEISAKKWLRRKCERKYEKKKKLESNKLLLKDQSNKYNNLLNSTKKDYIKNKIENAQSSKDLYKICDTLLNREQSSVLPSHDCATSLAYTLVYYFKNKIELICSNLEQSLNTSTDQLPSTALIFLEQFRVVSESDARKVITSSPTKSCAFDPIPTWLLKQCLDQVAPVLMVIVNTSLSCADFTPELNRAFVTPLIKKLILDCEIFKNYRPVSIFSFVSKLIARIICMQLVEHLKKRLVWNISIYIQTTPQHWNGPASSAKWHTPSRGFWKRSHISTSRSECSFRYHWPSETFGFIRLLLWN